MVQEPYDSLFTVIQSRPENMDGFFVSSHIMKVEWCRLYFISDTERRMVISKMSEQEV